MLLIPWSYVLEANIIFAIRLTFFNLCIYSLSKYVVLEFMQEINPWRILFILLVSKYYKDVNNKNALVGSILLAYSHYNPSK